jgi:hypothetical protein
LSCLVLSCLVLSCLVLSCLVLSCLACLVLSCLSPLSFVLVHVLERFSRVDSDNYIYILPSFFLSPRRLGRRRFFPKMGRHLQMSVTRKVGLKTLMKWGAHVSSPSRATRRLPSYFGLGKRHGKEIIDLDVTLRYERSREGFL